MSERVREPTEAEISHAAWAWCNDKDRETGSDDVRYFKASWRSLPGLESYVAAEIEQADLRQILGDAIVRQKDPSHD